MSAWQLQTAKAKLSELLRAVREQGPQTISVHGREDYVVMRKEDAPTPNAPKPKTLFELFEPVRGLGEDLEAHERGVREDPASFDDKR